MAGQRAQWQGQAQVTGLDSLQVDLAVVLGKTRMPLSQLLKLGRGAVVALDSGENDPVEILANGHPIARGHVVVTGSRLSVEVTEMVRKDVILREPGTRIGGGTAIRPAA
jgi:flagellar motor switch protein FliN/FliY